MNLEKLNKFRVKDGMWKTTDTDKFGFFFIGIKPGTPPLKVMSAPFDTPHKDWEHVSVSLPNRCPTWDEMCKVKDLFWDKNQTVIQFHPPEGEYVNNCGFCLHLWRNVKNKTEIPPTDLVGIK